MVSGKKTKKTHESINNRLALVMKSGKYTLGYKTVLESLRSSKDNDNLGTACGKYFRVPYPNYDSTYELPTLDCSNERAIAALAATQCSTWREMEMLREELQQSRQALQLLNERIATLEARGREDRHTLLNIVAHLDVQVAHAAPAAQATEPPVEPELEPPVDPGSVGEDSAYPNYDSTYELPTLDCSNKRAIAALAATVCSTRRELEMLREELQQSRQALQLSNERIATLEVRRAEDRHTLLNIMAHLDVQVAQVAPAAQAAEPPVEPELEPLVDPGSDGEDSAGSVVSP